jgi:hypothetical protein
MLHRILLVSIFLLLLLLLFLLLLLVLIERGTGDPPGRLRLDRFLLGI